MASILVIKDATTPLDTSNWTQVNKKSNMSKLSKEKLDAMKSNMKTTKISIYIRIPQTLQLTSRLPKFTML
jgi:hypothetical protein